MIPTATPLVTRYLKCWGRFFATHIRIDDYAIRYGGEEFLIVLPQVPYGRSLLRGNQIRQVIQQIVTGIQRQEDAGDDLRRRGWFSGTRIKPRMKSLLMPTEALYKAKEMGRNRIEVYMEGEMQPPFTMNSDTFEV